MSNITMTPNKNGQDSNTGFLNTNSNTQFSEIPDRKQTHC